MGNKARFTGYMCGTDFLYEQGQPREGNTIFATPEATKKSCCCEQECGVVKVSVEFVEWETPQSGMMAGDNPRGEDQTISLWEYMIIKDWEHGNPDSEEDLNDLGKDGWELVAVKREEPIGYVWYFKREVT